MQTYVPHLDWEPHAGEIAGRKGDHEIRRSEADILLAMTDLIVAGGALPELFRNLGPLLRGLAKCDVESFSLYDPEENCLVTHLWEKDQGTAQISIPVDQSPCGWAWEHQEAVTIPDLEHETRFGDALPLLRSLGVRSYMALPVSTRNARYGALGIGKSAVGTESQRDMVFLGRLAQLMALTLENRELRRDREEHDERLRGKSSTPEIRDEQPRDDIVGKSAALKRVLDYAAIVANTDATVLITGETGTGKERVAHAIHRMSSRHNRSFVKMNCAAIPTGLLESELFGHEKGAFTGAVSPKAGRLELADRGTLLLDEVGEIPLELQPKLLRVLQDQEFERLGSTRTLRVDVRLIAASNRDLVQAVEEKEFRSDLFYRLHVFPLHLPPLRERREDIPLLVRYFVEKCAARLNKKIDFIPDDAVEMMMNWTWPGNIRELENFIERSVILSEGNRLHPPLSELRQETLRKTSEPGGTLRDRERDHIVEVLRQTRGVLSGPSGAASKLGLKRTTLQYKMQRLGISRRDYLD